jgi:hypothetical protein
MNAKTCKALRRKAEALTVGRPAVEYWKSIAGVIIVDKKSTRGVYLSLKAASR